MVGSEHLVITLDSKKVKMPHVFYYHLHLHPTCFMGMAIHNAYIEDRIYEST